MKQLSMEQLQRPHPEQYKSSPKIPIIVVLDNVRSGLNVGAVFRSCDAFSVQSLLLCGITAQPPHPEILKTALGSTDSVEWQYFEKTMDAITELIAKGYHVLPVEQTDHSIMLDQFIAGEVMPVAFVFGNELKGVSQDVLLLCHKSLEIPQSGTKHSLNVATTAGIVLWECYRQYRLRLFLSSGL